MCAYIHTHTYIHAHTHICGETFTVSEFKIIFVSEKKMVLTPLEVVKSYIFLFIKKRILFFFPSLQSCLTFRA